MSASRSRFPELPAGLRKILPPVNAARREGAAAARREEEILEALFRPSIRLAIYGSLAPGESNHRIIEAVEGTWEKGFVRGELMRMGWGTHLGFPAMRWDPAGEKIPVKLLVSEHLPDHWERLDGFEGVDYRRVLVPVHDEEGLLAVANIYEAAPA